jgi:uncharacterized protein (DUF1778 family)
MKALPQPASAKDDSIANGSVRINLRTSPEAKELIEYAAALSGASVSNFVLRSACEAASLVINDANVVTLSRGDLEFFISAIENPCGPSQALIDLMAGPQ